MARYHDSEAGPPPALWEWRRCAWASCARVWRRRIQPGRAPRFCSDACKQVDYRHRLQLRPAALAAYRRRQRDLQRQWEEYGAAEWAAARDSAQRSHDEWSRSWWDPSADHSAADPGPGGWAADPAAARARALIFDLARLPDDGLASVASVWRAAARLHHPDAGGVAATFRELVDARATLRARGQWR